MLGESATVYTLQIENLSRKTDSFPKASALFLTVKVLECGGEEQGTEVPHRGEGGRRGGSPQQRASEVGEVVKVWSAPASPSPITSPPLSTKNTIKQQ